jgi:hypothetical protein
MAILKEKEWIVKSGMITANFYAEFRNHYLSEVYCNLQIDGFNVTWSSRHHHGNIRVYEIGKVTQDWIRLLALIRNESVEKSLKEFINNNLTFDN